jgi:hypothetical protein
MKKAKDVSGRSIWEYVVNTLDPVVNETLISNDNYFYFLCVQGKFSRRFVSFSYAFQLRVLTAIIDATPPTFRLKHTSNFPRLAHLMAFVSTPMRSTKSSTVSPQEL